MNDHSASGIYPQRHLNLIGYWASSAEEQEESPGWPDPTNLIGIWDPAEKQSVIKHLSSGIIFREYLGDAHCRICNALLGSDEMTDGTWAWPQKLEHYVDVHDVLLPKEFIQSTQVLDCGITPSLRQEFVSPETWIESSSGGRTPVGSTSGGAVILNPNAWLDWAAGTIPERPATDAITFEEARSLCSRLSHRDWAAYIEERFGRWRITCRCAIGENLIYVERCRAEVLRRRVLAWRYPDPDALLTPEQAQAIAGDFDGTWGAARLVAITPEDWLIWVKPHDREWPTESDIQEVIGTAAMGWTTFTPGGAQSFLIPQLDEVQWRMVLDRTRASRVSRAILQSKKTKNGCGSSWLQRMKKLFVTSMQARWRSLLSGEKS